MSRFMTWRTALVLSAVLHLMLLPGLASLSPKTMPPEEKNLITLELNDAADMPFTASAYPAASSQPLKALPGSENSHFTPAGHTGGFASAPAVLGEGTSYAPTAASVIPAAPSAPSASGISVAATPAAVPQSITIPAKIQSMVRPVYPEQARRDGLEGNVSLIYEVLTDGRVGSVQVSQSSGYALLDEAAIQAVRQWQFTPARDSVSGTPKEYTKGVTLTFNLNS